MSKLILFHPEISEKLIIIENLPLVKLWDSRGTLTEIRAQWIFISLSQPSMI